MSHNSEYQVKRDKTGSFSVYDPNGKYIGPSFTLWGAKRKIKQHKKGKGPGTVAYKEEA